MDIIRTASLVWIAYVLMVAHAGQADRQRLIIDRLDTLIMLESHNATQ